ncbi:hypothetical protein [Phytoactinopolyspora limicola]|uniref:hypothetical protein n=1 Tax=Phytoactinopolyspora limicola TaxID=2715536 RepID=UPI0031B6051E
MHRDRRVRRRLAAARRHSVALRQNGTVVAVGDNRAGECTVDHWVGPEDGGRLDSGHATQDCPRQLSCWSDDDLFRHERV